MAFPEKYYELTMFCVEISRNKIFCSTYAFLIYWKIMFFTMQLRMKARDIVKYSTSLLYSIWQSLIWSRPLLLLYFILSVF